MKNSLVECADSCAATIDCVFFIYGTGTKRGRCWQELTNTSSCTEGWEQDEYDFYMLHRTTPIRGCTDERASNYNAEANVDDGSCEPISPCFKTLEGGACTSCNKEKATGTCADGPYRSADFDQVTASRVAPNHNPITIDGDLTDWATHSMERCYHDVPFAVECQSASRQADPTCVPGAEVKFETTAGGKWFGTQDFSIKWMAAWDDRYLYLAADVTDDTLQVGHACYENGLQLGFEVGGPDQGDMAGVLQAVRSPNLAISRLELINIGLREGQTFCATAMTDPNGCCMDYELSQQGIGGGGGGSEGAGHVGFFKESKAAILRNPITKHTIFEVAIAKRDLLGGDDARLSKWGEGLTFGFSMLVNDGDDTSQQQGWAGYYPHAIVDGWNHGQKEPAKLGTMRLGGSDPTFGGDPGHNFGSFVLGALLGVLLLVGGMYAYRWYRGKSGGGGGRHGMFDTRSRTGPGAPMPSDHSSFVPPTITQVMQPSASVA